MDKEKIIKQLLPGALLAFGKYGVLPSVTIAQAILETGWFKFVKGNNIFGIKWTKGCGFEAQEFLTGIWRKAHSFRCGMNSFPLNRILT
jgi:lysozyme